MSNACRIPHNLSCQSYHLHRFTSTTLCLLGSMVILHYIRLKMKWCGFLLPMVFLRTAFVPYIMHTFDGLVACVFNAFGTGVSSLLNTQNAHSIFCVFRQIKIEEKLLRVSAAPRPFLYFYFYRYTIIIAFLWSLYMFVFLWICSLVCFLCDPSQASKQSE